MKQFMDLPEMERASFEKHIKRGMNKPRIINVVCNDIKILLSLVSNVAKSIKTHDLYFQPNIDFFGDLTDLEFAKYKEMFDDYCNYFDKHRITLISRINKKLVNYSKNSEREILADYPKEIKMFLVVENLNFWDLNSQIFFAKLTESNPNIIVINQIRSDFDFAAKHIDHNIWSRGSSLRLKEK